MVVSGNTIAHEALVDQNSIDWRRQFQQMLGYDFVAAAGVGSGGVSRAGDCVVSAGAGMSVNVAAGFVAVRDNSGGLGYTGTGGVWTGYNDAALNVVLEAADGVNPRLDRIGFGIRDAAYSGATNDGQITYIKGTPAGVPAVAAVPATYIAWVDLATVLVPAGAAVPSTITDYRRRLSALGGITVCTSTTRPSTNLWQGLFIYETDTAKLLAYAAATASWQPPWNLPWGLLMDNSTTTGTGITGAHTAETVVATSTAVTVPANRKIKISAGCHYAAVGAVLSGFFRIRRGTTTAGTLIGIASILPPQTANAEGGGFFSAIDTGASGSTQWVLTSSWSGNVDDRNPVQLIIEDVGMNAVPA